MRATAGAVGRVEAFGDNAFVACGDGRGEERPSGTDDSLRHGHLGHLQWGAGLGQAVATNVQGFCQQAAATVVQQIEEHDSNGTPCCWR